jgi:hypothetical protein
MASPQLIVLEIAVPAGKEIGTVKNLSGWRMNCGKEYPGRKHGAALLVLVTAYR